MAPVESRLERIERLIVGVLSGPSPALLLRLVFARGISLMGTPSLYKLRDGCDGQIDLMLATAQIGEHLFYVHVGSSISTTVWQRGYRIWGIAKQDYGVAVFERVVKFQCLGD